MKQYGILILTLVMIAALLTGCGCTNNAVVFPGRVSTPDKIAYFL